MGAASQELTERAKLLISERRYQEAVRACRRALLSSPGQVEIRLLLGEALLALERYDEVRVEMIALARKAPDRAAVHRLLGEAYLRDGRPTEAIESLRRALSLDPRDEVAQELIAEAADESAPVSTTIERWFAEEAEPTLETESPAWEEVHTPVPGATHPPELEPVEPSIQIDPSLVEEALAARPKTSPASPRVRSKKATLAGSTGELSPAPPADAPLPPPPVRGAEPPSTKPVGSLRSAPPPSAPPPPSPVALGAAKPLAVPRPSGIGARPPVASRPPIASRPPSSRPPPAFPAPPAPAPRPAPGATSAGRPSAMRDFLDPVTDELSLDDLDSGDLAPVPPEHEPARARATAEIEPPAPFRFRPAEPVSEDDAPTLAFTGGIDEDGRGDFDLDEEQTGEAPPVRGAPPRAHFDPPTYDEFPAPVYQPTSFAEPDEPRTSPKPTRPADRTPAVPPSGQQALGPPRRARGRAWILPAITGGLGLIVLAVVITFGVSAWMEASEKEEIRAEADAAGVSGARPAIEALIARIGEPEDEELRALRARLLATLTFEHGEDHAAEVQAIVGGLTASEAAADARIAVALIALAEGDVERARISLDRLPTQGEQIAEAFRAQALMLSAMGEWEDAMGAASTAVHHRPTSPRHISLQALTGHRSGRTQSALTLLEGTPDAENEPAIRIVRARILADAQSDPAQAVEDASAVIDRLAERATPPQLAWAHLIRASEGDPATSLVEARAAAETPPPGDEAFRLQLVRVLLRAGAAEEADTQLARLPDTPVDAQGAALLTAEVALAVQDLARAEAALGRAGAGNRQDLLRAMVYEARGQADAARSVYQRVMEVDPGREGRTAAVRLAAIEMATTGDASRVIALLEPRQPAAEAELDLVVLLARAYLARGRIDDAERVVDAALRRRPGEPVLAAARGAVLLARGRAAEALPPLRAAAEALPRDADVRADLGRAALAAGQRDEATRAYEAALAIDADHPRALVGMARVAFDAGDFETANTRLGAVGEGGPEALESARLRAQLEVVRGTGAAGSEIVDRLARVHRDAVVLAALGDLHAQAEQDSRARRAYEQALELDAANLDALIGQALLQTRAGSFGQAEELLGRAATAAEAQGRADATRPRIEAARGWVAFERDDYDEAVSRAEAAIQADAQLSIAHLLLGTVAIERGENALEHLRRAAAARAPAPEALGQLAAQLPFGEEACAVAARYLLAAPRGYDASDVRRVQSRCGSN